MILKEDFHYLHIPREGGMAHQRGLWESTMEGGAEGNLLEVFTGKARQGRENH